MLAPRKQRTLAHCCSVSGRGYWSGDANTLHFLPAEENHGVQFELDGQRVPADVQHSDGLSLRTRVSRDEIQFDMVEHVMAALAGLEIDNCLIRCESAEMPGFDGSSLALTLSLQAAGIETQIVPCRCLRITTPVRVGDLDSWILAEPVAGDWMEVGYELDYPEESNIPSSSFACRLDPDTFRRELAPARTFVTEREAVALQDAGLGTHVSYRDLLVFGSQGPIDNSLRFSDECARHKTLDLVGDLALVGVNLIGRFTARKSGHQLNAQMAQKLSSMVLENQHLDCFPKAA